ncbi:MAG: hypothetical protein ACD_62C00518G0003 [uncultured bacterium]|nr:MAG: hypothetical protein ACD_62C00518G0003 [uncultured bacterium]
MPSLIQCPKPGLLPQSMDVFDACRSRLAVPYLETGGASLRATAGRPAQFFDAVVQQEQQHVWRLLHGMHEKGPPPISFTHSRYGNGWYVTNGWYLTDVAGVAEQPFKSFTLQGVSHQSHPNPRLGLRPVQTTGYRYVLGEAPRVVRDEEGLWSARKVIINSPQANSSQLATLTSVHRLYGSITEIFKDPVAALKAFFERQIDLYREEGCIRAVTIKSESKARFENASDVHFYKVGLIGADGQHLLEMSCEVYLGPSRFFDRLTYSWRRDVLMTAMPPFVRLTATIGHNEIGGGDSPQALGMLSLLAATDTFGKEGQEQIPLPQGAELLGPLVKLVG